jgi:hypothetical protein
MKLGSLVLAAALAGCGPKAVIAPVPAPPLAPHGTFAQDTAPKEELRMVPPEVYMKSYLRLFGERQPLAAQAAARGGDGAQLFDTWDDYFSALGFPDYKVDLPRATQTNALMVAAFERLGVALCDRAVQRDLGAPRPQDAPARQLFTFDAPKALDAAAFAPRFDALHRAFLGYPARLAPTDRTARFFALYTEITKRHPKGPKQRFTPEQAGWASVCYGLVRHPEFHLY